MAESRKEFDEKIDYIKKASQLINNMEIGSIGWEFFGENYKEFTTLREFLDYAETDDYKFGSTVWKYNYEGQWYLSKVNIYTRWLRETDKDKQIDGVIHALKTEAVRHIWEARYQNSHFANYY